MTTEQQEEVGPVTVQIGVCSVCHALFLVSGERETSPCHGADPLAIIATLTIGTDGEVDGVWGSHIWRPMITREEAISMFEALGFSREDAEKRLPAEEPAPAPAPPQEPAAAEAPEEEEEKLPALDLLPVAITAFLVGDKAVDEETMRGLFQDIGAEPEVASIAVGRLEAVRTLLQALMLPRSAEPVAPAQPEAESSPENP